VKRRIVEVWVGFFMFAGIVALVMLALQVSGLGSTMLGKPGYVITARFDNIGGLRTRAPVALAGVRIGEVTGIMVDPVSFKAVVTMQIEAQQNKLPSDTSASVFTEGLLGANYISFVPGFNETFLKNGDVIQDTHPALIMENLIGQLLFNVSGGNKDKGKK